MPLIVTVLLVFAAIFCLTVAGIKIFIGDQLVLRDRLKQMEIKMTRQNKLGFNEELQEDFSVRILNPVRNRLANVIQKYTPVKQMSTIERKLDYAGRPFKWTAGEYLSAQYLTTVAVGVIAYVASWLSGSSWANQLMAFMLGLIGGYLLFELYIADKISRRQKDIQKALPDTLDLLTVSIEAGLGFDAAMQRVVQKSAGPISEEFNTTLQEMRMGKTRRDALRDLSQRTGVLDLNRFIESLIQADQLGVSLGNVLRAQSDQMRILRRQRIQEQAMKAPVKMLFPMVIFIFPATFIIILAPSILQIIKTL